MAGRQMNRLGMSAGLGPRLVGVVLLGTLAWLGVPGRAAAPPQSEAEELEARVREWLVLRREAQDIRVEWGTQSGLLEDERRLLEQQQDAWRQKLTDLERAAELSAAALGAAERRRERAAVLLARVGEAVAAAETHLRGWEPRLPALLRPGLESAFNRLEQTTAPPTPETVGERLQLVLRLYGQIEQLDRNIHAGRLVLKTPAGVECEVDVLFLGLAAGYAVTPDATRAAVARPTADGWTWSWDPALAPAVAEALACYRKDRPAALVDLPLRVEEGAQ